MLRVSTFTDLSTAGVRERGKSRRLAAKPGSGGTAGARSIGSSSNQAQQLRHARAVRFSSPSSSGLGRSQTPDAEERGRASHSDSSAAVLAGTSTRNSVSAGSTTGTRSKRPSVLLMAATTGDASWLQQCLPTSPPGEINQHGPEGLAPLHMVAKHGHVACLECLLAWPNVDVTLGTLPDGKTALHMAVDAKRNRVQCLKLLLRSGTPVNQCDVNLTMPLHYSAILGRTGCLMALVEAKADVTAVDANGLRPLELAKMWGKRDCARRLQALQWAAEKTQSENEKRLEAYSSEVSRVIRTRQQKLEQSIRGQESFDDWLSSKGLTSAPGASLSGHHTTSSLLHGQGATTDSFQEALTASPSSVSLYPASRLTSKFSSTWSVHSAPATVGHASDRDAISALASPSLPALLDPHSMPYLPHPPSGARPVRVSFRAKHQHRDSSLASPKKPHPSESSPKSRPKRLKRPGTGASVSSKKRAKRPAPPPRTSTPHPSQRESTSEEELMSVSEDNMDLPKLRIEELLLKERHQLPVLKSLAWASNHQLHNQSGAASPAADQTFGGTPHPPRHLRANSLCMAALRSSTLDAVAEEEEEEGIEEECNHSSMNSSLSDLDAYLGPTYSCLQLQCMSETMDSPYSASDLSHGSTDMFDRMSLSDD